MKAWQSLVLASSLILLAACGGGGGGAGGGGSGNTGGGGNGNSGGSGETPAAQPLALLAGNMGGAGNVDGVGAAASFAGLEGMARDANGNLYVADTRNVAIRKIAPDGTVSTFAGAGTGTTPAFVTPALVAVGAAGNVYVYDSGNGTLSKITPDGAASTLATVQIGVSAMAVDVSGNVILADESNAVLYKVAATGAVSMLAGSPGTINNTSQDGVGSAARFMQPRSLVADGVGNVYVADGSTLRKVTPAGAVTTVAGMAGNTNPADGTGAGAAFFYLNNLAIDGAGNIYGSDIGGIRKITPAAVVTTVIGNSSATLPYLNASALAVDSAGNLYAASGIVVRKMTPAGAMSVFAGSLAITGSADGKGAAAGFYQPYGLAVDASGNVIVADTGNDTIRRIDGTGAVTTLAGSAGAAGCIDGADTDARFNAPAGVAYDSAGILYVADAGNLNVRMMAPGAGVKTLAGACSGVLASSPQGGFINFDPSAPLVNGTGAAATFGGPRAVAATGSLVYLSDMESMQVNAVRAITSPGGVVTTFAGTLALTVSGPGQGPVRFGNPSGVVADAAGNVYVVDSYYQEVVKFPPDSPAIVFAGYPNTVGSSDGRGIAASFNNPTGLAIDNAGNLYVADTGNNLVRKITPDGTVSTVAGTRGKAGFAPGALPGVLSAPRAVAVSGTALYIAMANGVAVVQNRP